MANSVRGEVELRLSGKDYVLKPEFECLLEAEEHIGKPLPLVFLDWGSKKQTPSLKEMCALIYGGLSWMKNEEGVPVLSFKEVGELIRMNGISKLYLPVIKFLKNGLAPERLDENEKEELPEKKTEDHPVEPIKMKKQKPA